MKTYIKKVSNSLLWGLIAISLIVGWYLLWIVYPYIIEIALNFINSPKFIWFISIMFILSFLHLIYLLTKEGFNKKTFLKFWDWTDKVIIVRLFIYIFIFSLIFAYIIIPIQKYFYLNSS